MNSRTIAVVVIVLLWAFSAVLALSETAFVRASRIRLINLAEEGDKRAERVLRLLERPEQTMNTVLLMLLACQMVSATLLGTVLEPSFGVAGVALGIVIEIVVVFTFAEVAPKTFAVQHAERAVMTVSGLLTFVTRFPPLRRADARVHRARQRRAPGQGIAARPVRHRGGDPHDGRRRRAGSGDRDRGTRAHPLDLRLRRHRRARGDGAPPRHGRRSTPTRPIDEAIRIAISAGKSRLPAYHETTDDIVGLVFLKDLVTRSGSGEGNESVRQCCGPPTSCPSRSGSPSCCARCRPRSSTWRS